MAAHRFLHIINPTALGTLRNLHISWHANVPIYMPLPPDGGGLRLSEGRIQMEGQYWEAVCRILNTVSNLRTLYIRIMYADVSVTEEKVLYSLRSLRVENFTVLLQWPEWFGGKYALASGNGYPFELIRPIKDLPDQDWEEARLNRYDIYR